MNKMEGSWYSSSLEEGKEHQAAVAHVCCVAQAE
jgi:hypothetical protein